MALILFTINTTYQVCRLCYQYKFCKLYLTPDSAKKFWATRQVQRIYRYMWVVFSVGMPNIFEYPGMYVPVV